MPHGFDSVYTLYRDTSWGGGYSTPYPLMVTSETLNPTKEIRDRHVGLLSSRTAGSRSWLPATEKPQGDFVLEPSRLHMYRFLSAHFQMRRAVVEGEQFEFYPTIKTPSYQGTSIGAGTYGSSPGAIYSISVEKIIGPSNAHNNCMMFRNGLVNTLELACSPGNDLEINAKMLFRSWYATNTSHRPMVDGTVGFYSIGTGFRWYSASITAFGTTLDINDLKIQFNNNLQEHSTLGTRDPRYWKFGEHETYGAFSVYAPNDAMRYIGTMLAASDFAFTATFNDGAFGTLVLDMPSCVLQPFNLEYKSGNEALFMPLQFKAFAKGTNPSTRVTLFLASDPEGFIIDAGYDVADRSSYDIYDATLGTRNIATMLEIDRDY